MTFIQADASAGGPGSRRELSSGSTGCSMRDAAAPIGGGCALCAPDGDAAVGNVGGGGCAVAGAEGNVPYVGGGGRAIAGAEGNVGGGGGGASPS